MEGQGGAHPCLLTSRGPQKGVLTNRLVFHPRFQQAEHFGNRKGLWESRGK